MKLHCGCGRTFIARRKQINLMKKILIRAGIAAAILVVVALLLIFFSLNSIVKKGVETLGPGMTKVTVTLGSADISPFSGGGRLKKLFVGNPEGYQSPSAIRVGDVKVSASLGSLMSGTIVLNEINLQAAEITLEGSINKNNLTTILNNVNGAGAGQSNSATAAPATVKNAKKFIVKDLVIEGAKVTLNLRELGGKPMTVSVPTVHLQNIGVAENGVTADQLVSTVMNSLLNNVVAAALHSVTDLAGQLKNLGKDGSGKLGNAAKSLTDFFKN